MSENRTVDVVVIGAGMSGLSAARRLLDTGLSVVVVEARDRIGGRVWSQRTATGATVDRGGQWLGPTQNALKALGDEAGLTTFPTYIDGETVDWHLGNRHTYTGLIPMSDHQAAIDCVELIADLDIECLDMSLDAPWDAPDAANLDSRTLADWINSNDVCDTAKSMIGAATKGVFGTEAGEMSLLFALWYFHQGGGLANLARTSGGANERRFVGGAMGLAKYLAAKLTDEQLLLGSPVTVINWTDEEVRVTTSGPAGTVTARRAIIAMPPTVMQRIAFDPPLPGLRSQLQQRSPMGAVTKVHAIFDKPFWREQGLNGQVVSDDGAVKLFFDDSPIDAVYGSLVGFIAGNDARRLDSAGPDGRAKAIAADLVRYFGPEGRPREITEQHWIAEPFTGGGPVTVFTPGALSSCGPTLREPVGPLHWAGTETALRWTGYIDGAITSGERAAGEVADVMSAASVAAN